MLIKSFLDYLRYERNYSEKTVLAYGEDIKQLQEFAQEEYGKFDPLEVEGELIREWIVSLMDRGYTSTSVNRKLSSLRSFYKYLLRQGEVTVDPLRKITGPKNKKPLPVFLKESEMDKLLDDTDFLTDLNDRLSALGEAYAEDKDLMRMHFYKPDKVAALFQQFAKPYQNYSARDGFHWNEYKRFITEDEINGYFTRGSNYSDSRLAIYSFFLNHEDKKERADFLKDHYGIGGSSHALCGADDSHEDHDGVLLWSVAHTGIRMPVFI